MIVDGRVYNAVTNIGTCPSVKALEKAVSETYIMDKTLNLYGKSVEVQLIEFIREEKRFESIESLKEQIEKDIERAKELL